MFLITTKQHKEDSGLIFFSLIAHQSDPHCSLSLSHSFSQIERRISAFIERKQLEINENNVREFCNVIDCNQGENGGWSEEYCTAIANVCKSADFHGREVRIHTSSKTQASKYNLILKALYVLPNQVICFGHLWGVYNMCN